MTPQLKFGIFLKVLKKALDLEQTPSATIQIESSLRQNLKKQGIVLFFESKKAVSDVTIKDVSEKYQISQDTLRYYERIGVIPKVTRTSGGIRNYQEDDLGWVELAICMRSAGLAVESIIEYVKLSQQGDETIPARLQLLVEQKESLNEQKEKLQKALDKLDYKISRYEIAVKTGKLSWED